jgi:heat shock transcription factor, other eukaryote
MEEKLHGTEQKQQQMLAFMAWVMQNPEFMHELISQHEMRNGLEGVISKKRSRRIDHGPEADSI